MPITHYSVLRGQPTAGKPVHGSSNHYDITIQATGGPFTVAVNVQSVDGSEVLYAILSDFTPPNPAGLLALTPGVHALPSAPGGLALDFVREQIAGKPMITLAQMTKLPAGLALTMEANPMLNAVDTLLNQAIAQKETIFAFGSTFPSSGKVTGIHDIHMNQGNPSAGGHSGSNGVWQDGGLFLYQPTTKVWTAVFIAFQTESWKTDGAGNPATQLGGSGGKHHHLEG